MTNFLTYTGMGYHRVVPELGLASCPPDSWAAPGKAVSVASQ